MNPIELAERLGRWTAGRGPLPVLLAGRLRALIDEGELPPGEPLPADRAFAAAMNVGRSTVVTAYDLLRLEGRIVRRQGSGTRVAGAGHRGPRPTTSEPIFLHLLEPPDGAIPLACAAPDAPPPELAEAYARVLPALAATSDDIGYYPAGHPALRRAVADRYTRRGLRTGPECVLITSGAQQALSLLAQALLAPGDRVLVEGPTYPGALEAFRAAAARPLALPAGLDGLAAAARGQRIALAYAISTFHNPTGAVLPASARRGLVKAAASAGVPLIDDEVLADLGFPAAKPPAPLAAYDDAVISVGRRCAPGRRRPGKPAMTTCRPSWPACCPPGRCRPCQAARPCGYACRTVTGTRSRRPRSATASPSCRAAVSTSPGTADAACGCTSSPGLSS